MFLLDASNPFNLKQQLKFRNLEIYGANSWFTRGTDSSDSGLGFSFAILRGGWGRAWRCVGVAGDAADAASVRNPRAEPSV